MSWTVHWRGESYSSLDLTLDEVEAIENVADMPWSLVNPLAKIAAARAYLGVFLMRDGLDDAAIRAQLGALRLRDIAAAFEYVPDEPDLPRDGEATSGVDPTPEARSSPRSSRGARNGSAGRPTSPAANGSATFTASSPTTSASGTG